MREVSLGDYVLNGGEVAALAITEAVVRLLPGFMGNAESLVEESHEDGLLEYPVYTKPASWRGLDVPAGAAVAATTRRSPRGGTSSRVRRTAERRPDLLQPIVACSTRSRCGPRCRPTRASSSPCSAPAGSTRQRDNPGVRIPALHESLDDVQALAGAGHASSSCAAADRLVGAVRGVARTATAGTSAG